MLFLMIEMGEDFTCGDLRGRRLMNMFSKTLTLSITSIICFLVVEQEREEEVL
jgi:hypothetical protein